MKTHTLKAVKLLSLAIMLIAFLVPQNAEAQRKKKKSKKKFE